MKILGISSATKTVSVGIVEDGKILAELTLAGKEAYTEDLVVYLKKLIDETGAKIDKIAVTEGPGSYSGLRGGMATAKTLAQVYNLPVVGVSTLEAIAYNLIEYNGLVAAQTHAKSNEFNFALFGINNRKINRLTDDLLVKEEKLNEQLAKIEGEYKIAKNAPLGSSVAFLSAEREGKNHLKIMPRYSHKPNIRKYVKD